MKILPHELKNCKAKALSSSAARAFSATGPAAEDDLLPLGNVPINLTLLSFIRIFGCTEDTSPQQNSNKFGFVFGLFVSLSVKRSVLWYEKRY